MSIKTLIIPAALVFFASCDYVDLPTPSGNNPIDTTTGNTTHRKVLVEEVTGHFCPTCPAGAQALEATHAVYGDSMIIVAIHMGYFAQSVAQFGLPNGAPAGSFTEEFRTPEGDEYGPVFSMGQSAPRCMYNRIGFPQGNHDMSPYDAATVLDTLLDRPQSAEFEITHTYNEATRALTFSANGNFLTSGGNTGDSYAIVIMLTEDSLLGWQVNGTQYVQNYVFNHVLRACVNTPGTLAGTTIHSGAVVAGDTIDYALPAGYTLSNSVNHNHADLVVFVYNTITKEILQAEKVAIKE
ncbi:MAG: Omp28-related outer membrane protein [Bacteroidota bacterium]